MTYQLRVTRNGNLLISSPLSLVYGRMLVLFGLTFPGHFRERPQDAQVAIGRLVRTIEDALQENQQAHLLWVELCESHSPGAVVVDVISESERVKTATTYLHGGDGGDGAWPAGGGGGGGNGPLGSSGGNGADGAIILFQYDASDSLVDIETFVLPGSSTWSPPPGIVAVKPILFGGGGGGGASVPLHI